MFNTIPGAWGDVFKLPLLSNEQSKTWKLFSYCHQWQRKQKILTYEKRKAGNVSLKRRKKSLFFNYTNIFIQFYYQYEQRWGIEVGPLVSGCYSKTIPITTSQNSRWCRLWGKVKNSIFNLQRLRSFYWGDSRFFLTLWMMKWVQL